MARGSNDLNLILKARVVKLKVELDYKNSKLPTQVNDITKFLEKKPVKLKVKLDASTAELNRQIKGIETQLQNAKTFKPLKIDVEMNTKGSAERIKKQLKEVMDVVAEFNTKYGKQLQEMQQAQLKAKKIVETANKNVNIKSDAGVQNFNNIKDYAKQLELAEKHLRSTFSDKKGLFSSVEMKDAKGNLHGFVASLERANGVVEKIRYNWDKDSNKFQIVDRTTGTQIEKMVHKASQSLADLQRELGKTGNASKELTKEYKALEKASANGTLTADAVKAYQTKIKNAIEEVRVQKQLNDVQREQAKILQDIAKATRGTKGKFSGEATIIANSAKGATSIDELKNVRLEMTKFTDTINQHKKAQTELTQVQRQRESALRQLAKYNENTHVTEGALSKDNIRATQQLARRARTTDEMVAVQKRLNDMYRQDQQIKTRNDREEALLKLKKTMLDFGKVAGWSGDTIVQRFDNMKDNISGNLAQIENEIDKWNKKLISKRNAVNKNILDNVSNSEITNISKNKMKDLVTAGDITAIKNYLAETQKLNIATAKIATNDKGIARITTTLESTGKTAKQVTYEVDTLSGKLRSLGSQEVFNRNANLGIFEQLRIAMARVPVWMTAMTAFYGSINVVRSMVSEILKLDKALTELRRVASANISIDTMFEGGVRLSKELGNNVHDIMNSISELARTFGDFNERQLLAITKTATLMSNVSDLNAEEATNSLVGTMNAFNITAEDSIRIVDSLNEVDNNYAISTKQLAEGLSKSASTAKTFGVTMEEATGHITAIGAVTMESGKIIGNSLKTIYSRLTTIQGAEVALKEVGVAIYDQEGRVRKVSDILGDLAGRWNTISDAQKQNIAIQSAGRYQLSRFLALMNNWEMASEATQTAMHSEGSAMRENARYMKSFEARINQLKNSWTELSSAVGDSVLADSMLTVLGVLTDLAKVAIDVTNNFGTLPTLFGAFFLLGNKMGIFDTIKVGMAGMFEVMENGWKKAGERAGQNATIFQKAGSMASASIDGVSKTATRTASNVKTKFGAMAVAIRTFSTGAKLALASIGVGALMVGVGLLIEKLIGWYQEKKQKEEELVKLNKKLVDGYRSHRDGMAGMVDRYTELTNKQRLNKEEQVELNGLQSDFAKQLPTTVEYVDANGKAHMKTADAIRREVEQVAKLSQEQAKLDMAKFNEKLDKQAGNYTKIIDKVSDLRKEQQALEEENGKKKIVTTGYNYGDYGAGKEVVIDNTKEIQQNKVEILMAEAEKTEALKKTIKQINDQSYAWLEANNMMTNVTDEQLKAVENFVNYNEVMLRNAPDEASFKQAYQGLFSVGTQIGTVFSDAFDKMKESIDEADPARDLKLDQLKSQLDGVAKTVPETFYSLTDAQGRMVKSSDDVVNGLKEIVNVTNIVGSSGAENTDELIYRLQRSGLSAEDAKGYLFRLANESNNLAIKTELASQGIDETTGSLENLNAEAMEAIDLTQTLFGYSGSELAGVKSHIQAMDLLIASQGEASKGSEEYLKSQKAVTDFLGITADELENNREKYAKIIEALMALDLTQFKAGQDWEEFIKSSKLTPDQQKILAGWDGTKDIITGAVTKIKEEVKPVMNETKEAVGNIFDDVQLKMPEIDYTAMKASKYYIETDAKNMQANIDEVTVKLDEFGIKANTPTGVAVFDSLLNQLAITDGKIDATDNNFYILKQAFNTAIAEPQLLQAVQAGLDNTKTKSDDARKSLGLMSDTVQTPVSVSPFISPINTGLEDAKGKAEKLQSTWNDTQKLFSSSIQPDFNLTSLDTGLTTMNQTKIVAKDTSKATQNVVKAGSQVSPISGDLEVVNEQANKTLSKINKLNKSLNGLGEAFTTGKVVSAIGKVGKAMDDARTKGARFNSSLSTVSKIQIGNLPEYIRQLALVSKNLVLASSYGKKTANAQKDIVSAFSNVIRVTKAYNSAIEKAGNGMGATYSKLAKTIASATTLMINQYKRNAKGISEMLSSISRSLKTMVNEFGKRGREASNKVESMADKMHSEFKQGMNAIVKTASGVPARIGQAIRDNMSSASSAMDDVANDMVKRFKSELGIHSPSRVFEDLGYWTIMGLSNGLDGGDLKNLGKNVFDDFGGGVFDSWDMIKAYVSGDFSNLIPSGGAGGTQQWAGLASQALMMTGQFSESNLQRMLMQMGTESGGRADAINLWDSNAMKGTPSKGLMQVIDPTFRSYAMKGYDKNIYDPLSNMLASIRYAVARYGSLSNAYRGVGYEEGGLITEEHLAMVGEKNKKEMVIPLEQHRTRALGLWTQAGQYLGIDPRVIAMLQSNVSRGRGGQAGSAGSFGATSGEGGGSATGGGDSGSSGVMRTSVYDGLRSTEGTYDIIALASKSKSSSSSKSSTGKKKKTPKKKVNPREGIAEAFKFDKYDRVIDGYDAQIGMVEARINEMSKATVKYRDTLKHVVALQNSQLKTMKVSLSVTEKRQVAIKKELSKLPALGKQTTKQRETYNKLMQEYDSNLSKVRSLKSEIQSTTQDIRAKSLEIFTDFIDNIVSKYDKSIEAIKAKVDNTDFKIDVMTLTNPDDKKGLLNAQVEKAKELQGQQATSKNKVNSLQSQYDKAVKSKGKNSKEAKKVKEELDKAKEDYEDYTLEVLNAEKDIRDTRADIADEGIKTLKDYHENVKNMAVEAIELEQKALEDAHKKKMDLYDEEAEKITSVYDEKIKAMDKEKDSENYQEELNAKNTKKAELVNKIAILSRDTSIEGRKKVAELQKELTDVNKEIADFQEARQDELLRGSLEEQKNAQLEQVNKDKEGAELEHEKKIEALDKQKEAVNKQYEDLMNNDKYWAQVRDEAIKGNFKTLYDELYKMKDNLTKMNAGVFDGVFAGFKDLSSDVKKQVAENNALEVDNMRYNAVDPRSDVKEASQADKYKMTNGKVDPKKGVKHDTPDKTTPKKKPKKKKKSEPKKKTSKKPEPKKKSSKSKPKPKAKSELDRKTTSAVYFRKSAGYGNNVMMTIPKGAKVDYVGMEKGWAKIKYKGKTGFVGKSFLQKFDTGGYTGDWSGKEGKIAMLHKKELVLNQRQTSDILDTAKIMDKMTSFLPDIKRSTIANKMATAGSIVNISYGDINVTVENGDKKKGETIAGEILKGLKKRGK